MSAFFIAVIAGAIFFVGAAICQYARAALLLAAYKIVGTGCSLDASGKTVWDTQEDRKKNAERLVKWALSNG